MTWVDTADFRPSLRKYDLNRGHHGISSPEDLWLKRARMWFNHSAADQKGQTQLVFATGSLVRGHASRRETAGENIWT